MFGLKVLQTKSCCLAPTLANALGWGLTGLPGGLVHDEAELGCVVDDIRFTVWVGLGGRTGAGGAPAPWPRLHWSSASLPPLPQSQAW